MCLQQDRAKRLELLAVLGIVGAAFFAVALVALHLLEPEYNGTPAMSLYALGRYGGLMVPRSALLGSATWRWPSAFVARQRRRGRHASARSCSASPASGSSCRACSASTPREPR